MTDEYKKRFDELFASANGDSDPEPEIKSKKTREFKKPRESKIYKDIDSGDEVEKVEKVPRKRYQNVNGVAAKKEVALKNLAKARAARLAKLKKKKEPIEFASDSEEEEEAFMSQLKKPKSKPVPIPKQKAGSNDDFRQELDQLRDVMAGMAKYVKKHNKKPKEEPKRERDVILIPQQAHAPSASNPNLISLLSKF